MSKAEAKFTPGEWEIEPWTDGQLAIVAQDDDANDSHIVAALGGPDACGNAALFLHSREQYALLRRIDEAARMSGNALEFSRLMDVILPEVREVLGKVEGKTNA